MHGSSKVAVAIVLVLWLVPTTALANDDVTADGDVTRPTNARAFGSVCPGYVYGTAANVSLRLQKKNVVFTNSFANSTATATNLVTLRVAGTAQAGDGSNGSFTATIDGAGTLPIPTDWNGATAPFSPDSAYRDKLTPPETAVHSTVMLSVPPGAAAGSYEGQVSYMAEGTGYDVNNTSTPKTITDTQSMKVTWTVLAASSADCNRAPSVTSAAFASSHAACPAAGDNATLEISFDDPDLSIPGSGEMHGVSVEWGDGSAPTTVDPAASPLSVGHRYAAAGVYEATASVTDQHGATDSATASVTVDYAVLDGGVRQPVNMDGSSVFRYGSTVPLKIRFAACDGSIPSDLAPELSATIVSASSPASAVNESLASTSAADSGHTMRFSESQWIYNLATSSLSDPSAKYLLTITVPSTGQTVKVRFGLRT